MNSITVSVSSAHSAQKRFVQHLLAESGLNKLQCDGISAIYRLSGSFGSEEPQKIAKELLCDAIVEDFHIDDKPSSKNTVFVDVWYKAGVTDTVADSLLKAIGDLRISGVEKASSGLRYEFSAKGAAKGAFEKTVLDFTGKELLNPLVQECKLVKP